MSIIGFFQREFSYLTNNVKWRKWLVAAVLSMFTISLITNHLTGNEYGIGRVFVIFATIYALYIIIVNVLAFKTHYFQNIPNDITHAITVSIISSLWARVQLFAAVMIGSFIAYTYFQQLNIFSYLFEMSAIMMIYYNLTLQDSISVFIKIRQFGVEEDGEEDSNK